jgi:hypothetical protein
VGVAALVFDFLCIHPFRDGNGRISRLLTLLGLYQFGYEVGRLISLERLVEESRDDYDDALRKSSEGWQEGKHDLIPWLNYFLSVLRRAYREFEQRADEVKSPRGAKTVLVETAIDSFPGEFTLGGVGTCLPWREPGHGSPCSASASKEGPCGLPRSWTFSTLAEKGYYP